MEPTIVHDGWACFSFFLTKRCNLNCSYCKAGCGSRIVDLETELDPYKALEFVNSHFIKPDIHLTGGEPYMRKDLYEIAKACVDAGNDVTLFTNGTMLSSDKRILDLPISFHVSHQAEKHRLEDFLQQAELIRNKRHLVCRLYKGRECFRNKEDIENEYLSRGFTFSWINHNSTYHRYRLPKNVAENPSIVIGLIGQGGEWFQCSNPRKKKIGSVYGDGFDIDVLKESKCNGCIWPHGCQAVLSAYRMRITDETRDTVL